MSCHSQGGSCQFGHSSSCSCCGSKGPCSCHKDVCSCSYCKTGHAHAHGHEDFANQLIEMADNAWMELVKDKIKDHILASSGKELDKLAQLVAESNKLRWKEKLAMQKGSKDFKEKLGEFFSKK